MAGPTRTHARREAVDAVKAAGQLDRDHPVEHGGVHVGKVGAARPDPGVVAQDVDRTVRGFGARTRIAPRGAVADIEADRVRRALQRIEPRLVPIGRGYPGALGP